MQNLQKSIRTNAELTKFHSDKCRTYKNPSGQMQNLQNSIQTNAEITKVHSDKRQLENSDKRQLNNSDKCSFPPSKYYVFRWIHKIGKTLPICDASYRILSKSHIYLFVILSRRRQELI